MIDISEIQSSVNRAVSSVFGLNGVNNELDSLKSLCSLLESFNLTKNGRNGHKYGYNLLEYDFSKDFYQFLDNLKRLIFIFSSRISNLKDLDPEIAHLYIKIFLNITNILKTRKFSFNSDILSLSIIKIWCILLCLRGTNQIDVDLLKKNNKIFKDLIPLVLNLYNSSETEAELNKLLYIIVEIYKHTDDDFFLKQILESLQVIPDQLKIFEVYPGIVSRIINKLKDLNRDLFTKSIKTLTVWFTYFLDKRSSDYSNELKDINVSMNFEESNDLLLSKTSESITYILKKFRNTHDKDVCYLCVSCMKYDFLDNNLRYMMADCILESLSKEHIYSDIYEELKRAPISFELIFRDIFTKAINENGEKSLIIFNSYLKMFDILTWKIDNYLIIKFLLNNVQLDFKGVCEKKIVNKKYLIDSSDSFSEDFVQESQEIETFSTLYFKKLTNSEKLNSLSNLLSLYTNSHNSSHSLAALQLINELVLKIFEDKDETFCTQDLVLDLKPIVISYNMKELSEDISLLNLTKLMLINILKTLIAKCRTKFLTHKDMETILFNIIPECNSDFIKLSQSASSLLKELNLYFNKFISYSDELNKDRDDSNLITMFNYYTNSMVNKIIFQIDDDRVPDLVYTLTNFNNQSMNIKLVFDLTVQFSKYFDSLSLSEGTQFESNSNDLYNKLINVFYSFNYILIYLNNYLNENKIKIFDKLNDTDSMTGLEQGSPESGDEDGKGDFVLSISTLIITRSRYHISSKNGTLEYLAVLSLYRCLILTSKNEYILRIRVHEIWDCLTYSMEINLNKFRIISILMEIFKFITANTYQFVEKRLMLILELLEKIVCKDKEIVGVADERNSTLRYKCYSSMLDFLEKISKNVLNRQLFSQLMLLCLKIYSPKTCDSIKYKLNTVLLDLSKKNPTLVRNVLLEIGKGDSMNTSFIKFAFKRDLKNLFGKNPPQPILLDLSIIN